MSRLLLDGRYAFRTFLRGRFVTILAVLAFALGIGVTTAVFSIFAGVLLTPLPYPKAHELVIVFDTQPALSTAPASFPKYHDWKDRNSVFTAIGGSTQASFVLTGMGEPERVAGIATTASLVDVLASDPRWAAGTARRRTGQTGRSSSSSVMDSGRDDSVPSATFWAGASSWTGMPTKSSG